MSNHNPQSQIHRFFKQSALILIIIWTLVLVSSLLYYYLWNENNYLLIDCVSNQLFFLNIPIFCYALLSFVAERGLFNGIRYALKQTGAFFFKSKKSAYLSEFDVNSQEELTKVLKDRYLYTSPHSDLTYPLLFSSGLTFLIMIILTLL